MVAHIDENGREQTVFEHLSGTAAIAAKEGRRVGLGASCELEGALHDVGKNTVCFDTYIHKAHQDPKSVRRGEINHSSAGGRYLYHTFSSADPYERLTAELLSTAIVSHHGFTDCLSPEGEDGFKKRIEPEKEIYYEEAIENSREVFDKYRLAGLFEQSVKEISAVFGRLRGIAERMDNSGETLHFLTGCLERFLLSILVDADRTDTAEFMTGQGTKRLGEEERRKLWARCGRRLEERLAGLPREGRIAALRNDISEQCAAFAERPDGVYCLPIPTGGGKTLASLRYALKLAERTGKEHIFYCAPYLSILEQNADEYRTTLDADDFILEHHSNVVTGEETEEELSRYEMLADAWTSPIILTTLVQLLNTLFSGRMPCVRRMHQLKNSVLIIDEIQSLPLKCVGMFNTMMNFLSECFHTTVILCSATQPLLGGVEKKILYGSPQNMTPDVNALARAFKRVTIEDRTIPGGYGTPELADFLLEKLDQDMLVILNTKKAVRALYEEVKRRAPEGVTVIQLTTYMCPEHRGDRIAELKERLGRERILCISTQLIEAGVDISFQCVVRSLAGLDSVAQAAGRCNRNGLAKLGFVYLVNVREENTSSLPDIEIAKKCMQLFMEDFRHLRDQYDGDFLNPEAMEGYYERYFHAREEEMNYQAEGTTLYQLLSSNGPGRSAYQERTGNPPGNMLNQAFKTAGKQFEVIGSQTIGLIVPYGKAKIYIQELKELTDLSEIRGQLRKLQRYTVNLYQNDSLQKSLCQRNAIDPSMLDKSLYILNGDFYDDTVGLKEELGVMIF